MKHKLENIYIVGFLTVLILPMVVAVIIWNRLDHSNYENRQLTTWEQVAETEWSNFFPVLETYIQDNVPYKNECVSVINDIDLYIFHDFFDRSVMIGKDRWLFYKD